MSPLANRLRIARDYLLRRPVCGGLPVELTIEVTSRCNLRCPSCPRSDGVPRGVGDMSLETYRRILDQAAPALEFAFLHMAGEPLFHPQLRSFFDEAEVRGVRTGLSTNGTRLDRERAQQLIDSPLDLLIVSVDATDRDSYVAAHGADLYAEVVRNVESFLRLKTRAGRGPYTVLQMIRRADDPRPEQFLRRWAGSGADALRLKRFFNFGGNVEGADAAPGGPTPGGPAPPCVLLWRQLAVCYEGSVVSCCHDFLEQSVLGNIHEQSLRELWNGPAMIAQRRLQLAGRAEESALCAGCNPPVLGLPQLLGATAVDSLRGKKIVIALERLAYRAGRPAPY
ncbi:MAG: radical SAM protein [bacterium]